jgi:ornithine cyclodeaminase/alanine dehydrogenase-like protein (mu-crystallin family)
VTLLVLSAADVRRLLPYDECAAALRAALAALARGEARQPLRSMLRPEGAAGLMALMPTYMPGQDAGYGLKALCISPANPAAGLDAIQGIVLLSSARTGEPLAVLNASALTEIRTAAASAVATDLLARPDADVLAIIGTGVQARAHAHAIPCVRRLRQIRVAGRSKEKAAAFAAAMDGQLPVPVIARESAAEAVAGAGIIVTATNSAVPVLHRDWIAPGAHINAVGAYLPAARELDSATVAAAALFADSRESVYGEAGDYLLALADGAIRPGHVRAEIGEILTGQAAGRGDDQEITIFESLGLAVEDHAAAALVYRKAAELGAGCLAEF